MKKYQIKERALLLLVFAMMKEGFRLLDIDPMKVDISKFEDSKDMKIISLYRKLFRIRGTFTTEKISRFLDLKLKKLDDNLEKECQPLYIGLLVLYFYMKGDLKRDFFLKDLDKKTIEEIFEEHNKEFGISNCTINKAKELFTVIYKDEDGYIFFLELREKFPFNLKGDNND